MGHSYVLFDRDGTLIKHEHHLVDSAKVELLPDLVPGLKLLEKRGFLFGIVSNQSVINRGMATREQVDEINEKLLLMLEGQGLTFKFVLICPHTPEDACDCRKPARGMGDIAVAAYDVDPTVSFMIGDQPSDVAFGHALGCKSIQICDGIDRDPSADFHARNILAAARWITSN